MPTRMGQIVRKNRKIAVKLPEATFFVSNVEKVLERKLDEGDLAWFSYEQDDQFARLIATPKKKTPKGLTRLVQIADKAYDGDNHVLRAFEAYRSGRSTENLGDGLASFVAIELAEACDELKTDKARLIRALRVIEDAKYQLDDVQTALQIECDRLNRTKEES